MTEWKVVGPNATYVPLIRVHMIWGYWPDDNAIELHAAVDEYTQENNWEYYATLLAEAREKYGERYVREATVGIPVTPIEDAFDPIKIESDVPVVKQGDAA